MQKWIQKYKHGLLIVVYGVIYATWFSLLEVRKAPNLNIIHIPLDDHVPFLEIFAIPYFLWFGYVAVAIVFFFFKDVKEYYQLTIYLILGMTICLIIYTIWPNGQDLRPLGYERDNVLVDWVKALHGFDTSTNVWPSIHVYNSIVINIAVFQSKHLKGKIWIKVVSSILMVSICLSTVFIKQHSVADGLASIVLAGCLYPFIYRKEYGKNSAKDTEPVGNDV